MDIKGKSEIMPNELPKPWHWDDTNLVPQLNIEIPAKHILSGKSLKSIGRRQDNDDTLFELTNDEFKYAVVHLTWSQNRQTDTKYPRTELYRNWNDLYLNRILPDSKDWGD